MDDTSLVDVVSTLSLGDIGRCVCPACGGGRTGEVSATVYMTEGFAIWRCWRASCKARGRLLKAGHTHSVYAYTKPKSLVYREAPSVPSDIAEIINRKIKSSILKASAKYTNDLGGRVILPVFRRDNSRAGNVLRSYNASARSKALTDTPNYSGCAWFTDAPLPNKVIVTEDIPSAALAFEATGIASCALMGADLSQDKLNDILAARPDVVIGCLDEDALASAISIAKKISTHKDVVAKVVSVKPDIKDMDAEQLAAFKHDIENTL